MNLKRKLKLVQSQCGETNFLSKQYDKNEITLLT